MIDVLLTVVRALFSGLRSHRNLLLENLALRHQLATLQRSVKRPQLTAADRILWIALHRLWPSWTQALTIVKPTTVIAWHRAGFRAYWRWKSRTKPGRPRLDLEVRTLIRGMWRDNPTWGSPRIRDELAKLGIRVSDSTVRRYRPRLRKPPSQTWKSFLKNHTGDIAAIDFFVVPTVSFRILYVFIVLLHERRRIVHFNLTDSPSARWTSQQMIEAFPYDTAPRYVVRDRDSIYGIDFKRRIASVGIEQVLTAPRSPWQNPYVERVIGSIRRECLDHVVVLGEHHLRKILRDYLAYYHASRTHQSLAGDCPEHREIQAPEDGNVIALPVLGGLHHRYTRLAA